MNCAEWEREIAAESESVELAEHLRVCAGCREYAQELEANRLALGELSVNPAACTAVRANVLSEIRARKRRAMWWSWSAVAALAAVILASSYVLWRAPQVAGPKPVEFAMKPPEDALRVVAHHRAVRKSSGPHLAKAKRAQKAEPLVAVKMLTDDPNVIIIWLVDQKGDSL